MNECTVAICTAPNTNKQNLDAFYTWIAEEETIAEKANFSVTHRVLNGVKVECDTYLATCADRNQGEIIKYWAGVELEQPESFVLDITSAGKTKSLTASELVAG